MGFWLEFMLEYFAKVQGLGRDQSFSIPIS